MKRFSIFHIPVLSFFSMELYREVGLYWKGVGFAYLLLLVAVCSIPRMFKFQKGLSHFINEEVPPIVEQVPRITITEGRVHVDEPQPYYIQAPDSNEILAIIDTTGKVQSLVNTDALVLLTETELIQRQSNVEYRTYDLSNVEKFALDQDRIMGWLNIIKKVLVPVLYPFAVLGSFLFRIVQALIYAAIGLLFASWCRVRLSYDALIRLAVVAVTPCIIVRTILGVTPINLSMASLWYFLMTMVYLFFAVKACSGPEEQSPLQGGVLPENESEQQL